MADSASGRNSLGAQTALLARQCWELSALQCAPARRLSALMVRPATRIENLVEGVFAYWRAYSTWRSRIRSIRSASSRSTAVSERSCAPLGGASTPCPDHLRYQVRRPRYVGRNVVLRYGGVRRGPSISPHEGCLHALYCLSETLMLPDADDHPPGIAQSLVRV